MVEADSLHQELEILLGGSGLYVLGWFQLEDGEVEAFDGPTSAALIGNRPYDGRHAMWEAFVSSHEFADGLDDPLDRWTRRIIEPIADQTNSRAVFPFDRPYLPFQQWAIRAGGWKASPLGILIDPEFGMWFAFRAALVFRRLPFSNSIAAEVHPCDSCVERPCLSACPVDAFTASGFSASHCRKHLASNLLPDCHADGCRARAACPVGVSYSEAQLAFHMRAFAA